jgi:hypothetical protein
MNANLRKLELFNFLFKKLTAASPLKSKKPLIYPHHLTSMIVGNVEYSSNCNSLPTLNPLQTGLAHSIYPLKALTLVCSPHWQKYVADYSETT